MKTHKIFFCLKVFLSICFAAATKVATAQIYVDIDATGNNDGSSWTNAYTALQPALDQAASLGNQEVWVAQGTYKPTEIPDDYAPVGLAPPSSPGFSIPSVEAPSDREKSFHFSTDLKLYGGFDATETLLSERADTLGLTTILSGDFNDNDTFAIHSTGSSYDARTSGYVNNSGDDNAYHVLITRHLSTASRIDGFTVRGGHADDTGFTTYLNSGFFNRYGAGFSLYQSSVHINQCVFTENLAQRGGGMYASRAKPKFTHCSWSRNVALSYAPTYNYYNGFGGGLELNETQADVSKCRFSENRSANQGGALFISDGNISSDTLHILDCWFSENTAYNDGGAMYVYQSSSASPLNVSFVNAVVERNGANGKESIYVDRANVALINS
ncbi:MAG: hypothetical protein ACPGVE_08055, partial [Flavobacteriales bacterium]